MKRRTYLRNHVLERFHDLRTLGFLVVGEASSDDDNTSKHNTQVQLKDKQNDKCHSRMASSKGWTEALWHVSAP